MVKRWTWPLKRDLLSCSFLQLHVFQDFDYWPLACSSCLMAVQLYFFYKVYDYLKWNKLWNSPEFWWLTTVECQQVAPEGLNWNLRSMSNPLTIFHSNKFIRVLLPKLVIFLCVTHQGKNNFLNNSLLQRQWTISSTLLHKIFKYSGINPSPPPLRPPPPLSTCCWLHHLVNYYHV